MTMKKHDKSALVPKLRFPEFRDAEGWEETPLKAIANPVAERAIQREEENVLSLSAEHGIVLQSEFFGKKVAGENSERYLKIVRNDFVYNDRTTKASIYGTIKRLSKYSGGIVSPIYKCFRFDCDENPVFWEWYFESGTHDHQLRGLVNEGARAGRFNISITQFLSTAAWRPVESEQQEIADCLSSVDERIAAQTRKLDALKTHKKGLMQQLFPREGETQPRLRFPEFQNASEWDVLKFRDVVAHSFYGTSQSTSEEGQYPVLRMGNLSDGRLEFSNLAYLDLDETEFKKYRLLKGDILLNRTNSYELVGKISLFDSDEDCIAASYIVAYRLKKGRIDPRFCNYLLNTSVYRRRIKAFATIAVCQANINPTTFQDSLDISFPKLEEQERIADCLADLDGLIAAQTQKLEALKAHKKGLMQQLFPSPEAVEL